MLISRLRLLGFKSFVEPTELLIEPGLTGVVGPNGCGKSNLLEALRWVMGESSYKSMRASAMDDVIFSGTTTRPARNTAEVTIFLDNTARQAPADYNNADVIEITRRIEREAGSAYRINGREARARDVKILFEDAATGARSPSLVRQGQIGDIVNAKPEQRRRILEDAAGIAGLHSRRHEAELRLKAAQTNLTRLTDILGGLNSQVESLKRQARQARRYKEISGDIRRTEALHLHLSWLDTQNQVEADEANLREALSLLARATQTESEALRRETEYSENMQPLRDEEAKRGAVHGRLRIEAENFEREAERAAQRENELNSRSAQMQADLAREQNALSEASELIERITAEISTLQAAEQGYETAEADSRRQLETAESKLKEAEQRLADLTRQQAEKNARGRGLETALADRNDTITRISRHLSALQSQHDELAATAPDKATRNDATERLSALEQEVHAIEEKCAETEERRATLVDDLKTKRESANDARLRANALTTERETLTNLLVLDNAGHPAIVDALKVAPGYETALGAALGDDLDAPVAEEAPVHWRRIFSAARGRDVPAPAPLPSGAEPLSNFVESPPELTLRLQHIGVVDAARGAELQTQLSPGQRLVSLEGDLWRWDGYVAAADGVTAAAQRLAQLNRLSLIEHEEITARETAEVAGRLETTAAEALAAIDVEIRQLQQRRRDTQGRLAENRNALVSIEEAARQADSKLASMVGAMTSGTEELADARTRAQDLERQLVELGKPDDLEQQLEMAQQETMTLREQAADCRVAFSGLARERRQREERLTTLKTELERWNTRKSSAEGHIAEVTQRLGSTQQELRSLANLPDQLEQRRQQILTNLQQAEHEHKEASDKLAVAENELKQATQALRSAQGVVAESREGRARIEAKLEASRQRRQEIARAIRETFDVAPEECPKLAGINPGESLPELASIDLKLNKLKADRERLGGVNLQADDELERLATQFKELDAERADVDAAVNKLRGAIAQLNREGKKRLAEAFELVDGHFRRLFVTLFGGGEARLQMIESEEDPLNGGLEIVARPPGKKPATLSLLSGGEQSLTALSLIFAVFLTNPSPICVLDEVDAPLDDANVDRFCRLMEKMAEETDTRFLVITHHPMTMTRMNRLFGVTMGEKGVSQLVSVDLETAQGFREAG